jgi:hypothetical protein
LSDILEKISTYLIGPFKPVEFVYNGREMQFCPPNMAAGVAFGNESAALLAAGNVKGALRSAMLATIADPSYVKATSAK